MGEKGKRYVFNEKTGKFVEGKASPRLLDEEMRKMPGELVTTEVADGSRVHELDPPHIREALLEEYEHEHSEKEPDRSAVAALVTICDAPLGQVVRLDQWRVDAVRMRVILSLIERANIAAERGESVDLELRHLRFPRDNVNEYELHRGNPPREKARRQHERGLELWVDVFHWPKRLEQALRDAGVELPQLGKEVESQYKEYRNQMQLKKWKELS